MRARSGRSAGSGMWDTLKLEWEVGLRRLPFFTQRLAVALVGLLVVSLALVGAMAILWGGPQSSNRPLSPPPEARYPTQTTVTGGIDAPRPPQVRGGAEVPASARSSTSLGSSTSSTSTSSGAGSSGAERRQAAAPGTTPPSGTSTTTPPTTQGDLISELTVPPVLTTLLK
jgi:hypothetical protein